jgi:hypothetical protein
MSDELRFFCKDFKIIFHALDINDLRKIYLEKIIIAFDKNMIMQKFLVFFRRSK